MFRRISGSSSITRIFFITRSSDLRFATVRCSSKNGEPHSHGRAFADGAFDLDRALVQFNATFDDGQSQPGSRRVADIEAAVKGAEEPFPVRLRNADAAVANP